MKPRAKADCKNKRQHRPSSGITVAEEVGAMHRRARVPAKISTRFRAGARRGASVPSSPAARGYLRGGNHQNRFKPQRRRKSQNKQHRIAAISIITVAGNIS